MADIQPVQGVANGVAQPVSGTVTSNQGTANSIGNAWPAKVTDGTTTVGVQAAGGIKADLFSIGNVATSTNSGTVDNGTQRVVLATNQPTVPVSLSGTVTTFAGAAPSSANVLAGSTTTGAGTIITIPINRIWMGWISLSASVSVAASGAAVTATPSITVQSAGVSTPVSGTVILQASVITPTQLATTNVSSTATVHAFVTVYAPSATNTATLQLNLNSATGAAASANGWLI